MRPLQTFRSAEDDEEQVIRRASSPAAPPSRAVKILRILALVAVLLYSYLYVTSLQGRWFDPRWTTDDALQQGFIFHEIITPGIFTDDIIAEMMSHYISPLHYLLGTTLTYLTKNPVMTGHWIMLLQILLAVGFVFAAVKRAAGFVPACAGVLWLLHTRNTMQRITGGLQRGWAPAVLAAYVYFLYRGNHRAIFFLIGIAWLLHAPSALLIMVSYGLYLLWKYFQIESRLLYKRTLLTFVLLCPLYGLIAYYGVKKPEHLGSMVSYAQAAAMPEFSGENGRFKMVPLWPRWTEIKEFGFQAFNSSLSQSSTLIETATPYAVMILVTLFILLARKKREKVSVSEMLTFLFGIYLTYEASRLFAFKLFVPQRYIQIPMTVFFVIFVPILVWKVLYKKGREQNFYTLLTPLAGLAVFALLTVAGSGLGLQGDANFNMPQFVRGNLWSWVQEHIPERALIAGHPSHIDGVQLFGKRRGFVTNETAHPFYNTYYQEMRRRLEVSLRAHYARDLSELVALLEPEGIDYFIFKRKAFYPEALAQTTYFSPLDALVKDLTSHASEEYAYKKLPKEVDLDRYPFLIYRDDQSAMIDIKKLKEFISSDLDNA